MCLQLVQLRREVAGLLRANKQDNARIRVEAVIQEQKMLRAYDIIEVFVELLAVRVELIAKSKDIPPDMLEAVSSVVYAAQRIQVGLLEDIQDIGSMMRKCLQAWIGSWNQHWLV